MATKKTTSTTPAPSTNGTAKKDGLRKPQVRILAALAKTGKPMNRASISEKAPVDQAGCVEWIGSHDDDTRKANDAKHFPSLVSLGYVRFAKPQDESAAVWYEITASGRKALAAAQKAEAAKEAAK